VPTLTDWQCQQDTNIMTSLLDIGYAAGFYEGEGTFFKVSSGKSCIVSITQKDPEPLVKMQKLFGGEIRVSNGYNYWRLHGVKARGFILTIFSLLSRRRKEQILRYREFFTEQDACPNGHVYKEGSYKIVTASGRTYKQCIACQVLNRTRRGVNRKVEYWELLNKGLENMKKDGLIN